MKTLRDFNFEGKRVLVRCDFNVPLSQEGEILDDFRIRQTIPTIEYLIKNGAKVILMSHLGDPQENQKSKFSLKPVALRLEKLLKKRVYPVKSSLREVFVKGEQFNRVKFLPDCVGPEVDKEMGKMKEKEVVLLENLRFHKEEKENDEKFAQRIAALGEIFINDAFSVSHRNQASIVGLPKYLPSGAGILLEKEIKVLSQVLEKPLHPLVAIIGGVKIETKIKVIEKFLQIADHLLLGSKIAETILMAKEILVGRKFPEEEILERIKKIDLTNPKLHLPTDGMMALASLDEKYSRIGAIGTLRKEEEIFDIGSETIRIFFEIIKTAKMIIWNGPLGYFEKSPFDTGTKKIAEAICRNYSAFKIAGGGETDSFLHQSGLRERFDHVSTGGGAMLEFLAGEKLPGIESLNQA